MPKPNAPCKDCQRRQVGCRTDCTEWQQYEKEKAVYSGEVFEKYKRECEICQYKKAGRSKYLHQRWKSRRK